MRVAALFFITVFIIGGQAVSCIQVGSLFNTVLSLPYTIGRGLKQQSLVTNQPQSPYGQFAPITNRAQVYGGWGGSWIPANTKSAAVNAAVTTSPTTSIAVGSTVINSGTIGSGQINTTVAGSSGATSSMGSAAGTSSGANSVMVGGAVGTVGSVAQPASGNVVMSSSSGSNGATVVSSQGLFTQMPITTVSMGKAGTNFIQLSGATSAGTTSGSVNSGMAATATMQSGMTAGSVTGQTNGPGAAAATAQQNPINAGVVNRQATAFDQGYCVPRQSFLTVNVTALACNPGSNLTRWDGREVCARIDCDTKLDSGNIIYAPAYCRTVVEPAQFICPSGCETIQQTFFNTTDNSTRPVTRCACRAGNQPCPGSYTGCVCQPTWISSFNASMSYVLCSADDSMCDAFCNRTANQLGPLCPFYPDSTLAPDPAFSGPIYPAWGWNVASQGQATAAVAPGTSIGRRLLRFTRLSSKMRLLGRVPSSSSSSWNDAAGAGYNPPGDASRVWYPEEHGISIGGSSSSSTSGKPAAGSSALNQRRAGISKHLQHWRQQLQHSMHSLWREYTE